MNAATLEKQTHQSHELISPDMAGTILRKFAGPRYPF